MLAMYPRLLKRGKFYHVEIARNKRRSLGVTNERDAVKMVKSLQAAELKNKIAFLDTKERLSISEFIPLYIGNPDRQELSDKTLQADELAFRLLKDVLGDIPLKLVNRQAIRKFKEISIARVKPTSVNSYLRHIRSGLNWAKSEQYIDKTPQIKFYKIGKKITRYLTKTEVRIILKHSKKVKPEMHRIIQFALFTGCRRAEIVNTRYEHINNGTILITGKGDKERIIPLLPQALDIQQDIGKIFPYKHVSTVSNYFRKIAKDCGIKTRFHDLRHTAGTMMLSNGISLAVVQKILGHSDIRTTQEYAQVLAASMADEMKKLSYD